ncbi:hypothetical protein B0H19DRAFT_1135983 [Mycena capillaripes]|nr:hypothetical protein B0H19DRAFT_1135983 [Mycena capillaripes]
MLPPSDAISDGEATLTRIEPTEYLVIHTGELLGLLILHPFTHPTDEDEDMSSPKKKERSKEFILVPSELVYKTETQDDHESASSSGDEISIHVESPAAHDESLSSSALTTVSTRPDTDDATATEDPYSSLRSSRVRFRSRVRIASGLNHRRVSTTSSLSSSRSSSISAPLRAPLTEDDCTPGWGTLGQRVGLFAISNRQAAQARSAKQRARRRQGIADLAPTEHTALMGAPLPHGYDGHPDEDEDEDYSDEEDLYDDEALLSRQIDLVFGKWPGRLLNRQWWWWQLQPILCCGCLDEHDGEDIP